MKHFLIHRMVLLSSFSAWLLLNGILLCAQPQINSFSPANGRPGTLLHVSGTNLDNASNLSVGGTPTLILENTNTSVTALLMPGSSSGNLQITTPGGNGSSSGPFTLSVQVPAYAAWGSKLFGTSSSPTPSNQGTRVATNADGYFIASGGPDYLGFDGAGWLFHHNGVWQEEAHELLGNLTNVDPELGRSITLSATGHTMAIGGPNFLGGGGGKPGGAYVYKRSNGTWSQYGSVLLPSTLPGSIVNMATGLAMSAKGDRVVCGGPSYNLVSGGVWTFEDNTVNNAFLQSGNVLEASGLDMFAAFGTAVALSADGNLLLVSAPDDLGGMGSLLTYSRSGTTWMQQGPKVQGTGSDTSTHLGHFLDLSADGQVAAVGAFRENGEAGAVYLFRRNGNTWVQDGKLTCPISGASHFGKSLGLSADGNLLVVGAPMVASYGRAYVYAYNGTSWAATGSPLEPDNSPFPGKRFGEGVAMSLDGTTLVAGCPGEDTLEGTVYVFRDNPASGINESDAREQIRLYPNPANTEVRIESDDLLVSRIDVLDIHGRKKIPTRHRNDGSHRMILHIEELPSGIYVVRLTGSDGRIAYVKLFKK